MQSLKNPATFHGQIAQRSPMPLNCVEFFKHSTVTHCLMSRNALRRGEASVKVKGKDLKLGINESLRVVDWKAGEQGLVKGEQRLENEMPLPPKE